MSTTASKTAVQNSPKSLPLWLVILTAGTIIGIAMGRGQVMGLYQLPMTKALGVGRETFGLAMALAQLTMGLGAPFSGALIDKFGAGRIIVVCALASVGGLYLMYAALSGPALLVAGVLMGIGISGTGLTALVGTVGRLAPPEKRMSAIASLGMAAGIGGFIAWPYTHLAIEWLGWQGSLLLWMATTALMVPLAWPLSGKPVLVAGPVRKQTLGEALTEATRHPSFWLLTASFFVCGFHVAFIGVHLPAFLADKGLEPWVAPAALSIVGIANIAGTFLAGQSGRLFEKRVGLSLIYLGRAVLFLGFLFLPMTPVTVMVLCGILGFLWLSTIPLTSGLVATFFGTTWMSMLFGIVFLSHQVGAFLGVWLGGRLFDMTKSYDLMWWMSVALGLFAALISWPIKERPVARLAALPA